MLCPNCIPISPWRSPRIRGLGPRNAKKPRHVPQLRPSILIIQFADLPHLTINNLPLLIKYETDSIFSISLLHHNLSSTNNQNTPTSTLEYQNPLGYPKLAQYQPKRQHKMCREAPCELCSTFLTLITFTSPSSKVNQTADKHREESMVGLRQTRPRRHGQHP